MEPKSSSKIALLFWDNAPCDQAGTCVEFEPTVEKHVWRAGRDAKQCDPGLHIKNALISRIHFTLFFHPEDKKWFLIDGGVYKDGGQAEHFVRPSSNGIRIKTKREWERISGQAEISVGTLIWLGPDFRIAVVEDCSDITVGQFYWLDENWPNFDRVSKVKIEPKIEEELISQAEVTGWAIVLDIVNWLQEKPANRTELLYKLVVIACMLQAMIILAVAVVVWKIYPSLHKKQNDSRVRVELVRDMPNLDRVHLRFLRDLQK
ncbi:FHA domain-containing protein [Leptothoe spongobia]|uniref:FHA domain-containing protein n=1 Tax=Leptothoe spongobia TAU-MAC 1115 TaxID=1967444 RepID=A0A947GJ55_9CYAN|nr:FHA domain-containing protein [Leptothoe spongobia]MBT9316269.1 FHA domain-containing protein [Leptothoe spongobia TAU-MAC 1115]